MNMRISTDIEGNKVLKTKFLNQSDKIVDLVQEKFMSFTLMVLCRTT